MKTLIKAEKVIRLAFSDQEGDRPSIITEADIAEAESRYLLPVIGQSLYARLIEGGYEIMREEYIAPAVAAYTRYVVEPHLPLRCVGCVAEGVTAADNDRLMLTREALRRKAATLMRRLSDYLNDHAEEFAEYSSEDNILNRCSIYGDIVQVY